MYGQLTADVRVSLPEFEEAIGLTLRDAGMTSARAGVGARILVRTSARGFTSHGVRLLPMYLGWMADGIIDPRAEPEFERTGSVHGLFDGHGALGQVVAQLAASKAVELAAAGGIAAVGAKRSTHFGAGSHYALTCAEAGYVGLVWSSTPPVMAAPGARGPVVGNGPTAYGIPRPGKPPLVYDAAMSAAAGSKVSIASERGESIPDGWVVDADGAFSTDPGRRAALAPLGGHKGFALALLGELLAGALTGAGTAASIPSFEEPITRELDIGHLVVAIDPAVFGDGARFAEGVTKLLSFVDSVPTVDGVDHVRLPGERAAALEQEAIRFGLPLAAELRDKLAAAAPSEAALSALHAAFDRGSSAAGPPSVPSEAGRR